MNAEQRRIAAEIRETMLEAAKDYLELANSLEGLWIKVDCLGRVYWHLPDGYMVAAITASGRPIGLHLTKERADSARLVVFRSKDEADDWMGFMETHEGRSYFMQERRKVLESVELILARVA